jgi:hypothetical protein
MHAFLIKSVLSAILILASVGGVVYHFKQDREITDDLTEARQDIIVKDAKIRGLETENTEINDRIRARNQSVLDALEKAEEAKRAAEQDAQAAREEKKRSDLRLKDAQRKYQEAMNHDENLRAYSRIPVPSAVLDRLRSANGETRDSDGPL